jgi:hypothetical protein
MSNIQKTLDSLQPYVIGIRYLEGTPLVDAVFKEGWTVPEDSTIKRVKGNDEMNYYMLFSEVKGVGLDELLGYVDKTIKINLEREKKHDLLRAKVNELKEVFKKNSLAKLERLKFTFGEEDLVPKLDDFDIDDELDEQPNLQPKSIVAEEPEIEDIEELTTSPQEYLDENGKPIELTDEEKEILEEEARAERNRKVIAAKKQEQKTPVNNMSKKVELPPKRKIEMAMAERDYESDCECGPNDACEKCIDKKDY